jgi:hypothetical protein
MMVRHPNLHYGCIRRRMHYEKALAAEPVLVHRREKQGSDLGSVT